MDTCSVQSYYGKNLGGIKTPLITLVFSYLLSYPLVSFCISLQHRGIVFLTNTREYCLKRSDAGKINSPGHASFCLGKFAGVRRVGCWKLDFVYFLSVSFFLYNVELSELTVALQPIVFTTKIGNIVPCSKRLKRSFLHRAANVELNIDGIEWRLTYRRCCFKDFPFGYGTPTKPSRTTREGPGSAKGTEGRWKLNRPKVAKPLRISFRPWNVFLWE